MDQFLDPETDTKHQFLDPETVGKCQFLVKILLDPETDIMDQFLDPETDIKHQFLVPEIDKKCQFLDGRPETDVMDQFLDPETDIMGEGNYIRTLVPLCYTLNVWTVCTYPSLFKHVTRKGNTNLYMISRIICSILFPHQICSK